MLFKILFPTNDTSWIYSLGNVTVLRCQTRIGIQYSDLFCYAIMVAVHFQYSDRGIYFGGYVQNKSHWHSLYIPMSETQAEYSTVYL